MQGLRMQKKKPNLRYLRVDFPADHADLFLSYWFEEFVAQIPRMALRNLRCRVCENKGQVKISEIWG